MFRISFLKMNSFISHICPELAFLNFWLSERRRVEFLYKQFLIIVKKLPVEERVCKKCNNNAVEDKIHFLCECPMYDDLRKLYVNFDSKNPPIDRTVRFKQVLTDDSAENTRLLGKFLKEAFLRRKSEMDIPQPATC